MADTPPPSAAPRVFGALFLLVLFVVAIDMETTILWLIGLWIFGGALRALFRELQGRRSAVMIGACLASVVLFPGSCVAQLQAMSATMRRVDELGTKAQAMCDQAGVCPDVVTLCGGTVDAARSSADRIVASCGTAGNTVRFPIHYRLRDEARRFSVGARLSIDDSVSSSGGVGLPLARSHLMDGVEVAEPVTPPSTPAAPVATTP